MGWWIVPMLLNFWFLYRWATRYNRDYIAGDVTAFLALVTLFVGSWAVYIALRVTYGIV